MGRSIDWIASKQPLEDIHQLRIIGAVDHHAIRSIGGLRPNPKGGERPKDRPAHSPAGRKVRTEDVAIQASVLNGALLLDLGYVGAGHQAFLGLLGIGVPQDHVGGQRKQIADGQMPAIEPGDFDDVAKPLGEQALVELAEHPGPVLVDGADTSAGLKGAPLAVLPLLVACDRFEDFTE